MRRLNDFCFSLILPTTILLHLFWAPYTKVEESFNIQAVHDILAHGIPTANVQESLAANYDHVSFPGSVPRTFVGALVLSGLSRPFVRFLTSPAQVQLLVRAILGLYNAAALLAFRAAIARVFGPLAGNCFVVLQATQFHVMYYASRTLPNTFALGMSTLALRAYLLASSAATPAPSRRRSLRLALYLLTAAGVVFRSELALLVAALVAWDLAKRVAAAGFPGATSYLRLAIPAGLAGAVVGLALSVPVDTFFWRTWPTPLWPEWAAFAYNTLQGRSADWGVSPWHHYFASALPRLLLNPLTYGVLLPLALANPASRAPARDLVVPSLGFVAAFSALPHKEWRFIEYVVPALTGAAAPSAAWLWARRAKTPAYRLAALALVASVLASAAASAALLAVSASNYPGGAALARLHALAAQDDALAHAAAAGNVSVHLDNLACQTGVTRFLQDAAPRLGAPSGQEWRLRPDGGIDHFPSQQTQQGPNAHWHYDKTTSPSTTLSPAFWTRFSYVISENPALAIGAWDVQASVRGFGGIAILKPGEAFGEAHVGDVKADSAPGGRVVSFVELLFGGGRGGWDGRGDGVGEGGVLRMVGDVIVAGEEWVRQRVTRGWWVGVKMVPRLFVLGRARSGV
ncbi:glycosyltransferase family 22 protein [Aplosporella prunicola CBS 121167]|uniref:Mannosyltransferase n=1 Tax=Aplosporella prunicola CBS 121167 TaxID=1176127 RepID=A0A6A6BQP8_9PEZI|nr:glycosyltransferase family 22 protein [Aplosporella prunicola CBS 121167]KAF2146439.1 glycosyltransferase family 22 protein [Aplosporella prunicola CBS 121167]